MLATEKQELISIFGDRVAFNQIERMLYSGDVGVLPELARRQINAIPEAVVQPNSIDDLRALINLAVKYKTPLVPRGSGTAGYGGAIPTRGGIVVDFYRLNRIVNINKEERTVTVESGAVWNDIETELRRHGLALRLYPGSAISATVGGWIANGGGTGIGSFEYGYIKDNIVEVEIITPKGTRKLTGDKIDLVDGMAGTTGFISQVTLRVRDSEQDIPVLGAFPSLGDLVGVFQELREKKLPLWEVGYRDPAHVQLTHEAVERQAKRLPLHTEVKESRLPQDKFIGIFVYPKSRENKVRDKLLSILAARGGAVLDEELARFEWDERFYPIRLKALGPSIIPAEVKVPTEKLPQLVDEIKKKTKKFAFYGTLINNGSQTAVLTYALDDERRRGFPLAYAGSLALIKAAQRYGGRPYAIGMYFTDSAGLLLGEDKLLKIYEFKKEVDPDHIMNPGKVFPRSLDKRSPLRLNLILRLARSLAGIIRLTDKLFGGKPLGDAIKQKTRLGKLPFGKDMAWDAFACADCGYCRNKCPEFSAIGWESSSPRGKFRFLRDYSKGKIKLDERMAEMLYVCTTCGQCDQLCQVKSHIDEDWTLAARPVAWQEGFNPPMVSQVGASNILVKHNPQGYPQEKRAGWMPPGLKFRDEGEIGFWAGCSASFNKDNRNLAVNSLRILNKAGIEPVYLGSEEWCCGGGTYLIGCLEEIEETIKHNIDELNKRGIKTLITPCGGCYYYYTHLYPIYAERLKLKYQVTPKHITEIIIELLDEGKIKFKFPLKLRVTYHDPCHIARAGGIFEPPRKILASIPGVELVEMPQNRESAACCGRHTLRYPRLGSVIAGGRLSEAEQTGAQAIVSACPTCENNFSTVISQNGSNLEIFDITDLVAESMGLPTLITGKLSRLLKNQPKAGEKKEPQIYLTKEELAREESLFKPHEESYAPLKGRTEDIRSLSEKMDTGEGMPEMPKSC